MITRGQVAVHHEAVRYIGWVQSILIGGIVSLLVMPQSNRLFKNIDHS